MDYSLFYLELSTNPIRFDSVSQLTNVFFDDSNRQVFAVRSGGTTGIVVKGPLEKSSITFCMDDKGPIRSIKFSPDNQILAVQRTETSVEFIGFKSFQPNFSEVLIYKGKNSIIYGFVWVHTKEVALISNGGVEIFQIITEKRQLKTVKSINLTINWFSWCPLANFALLASNNGTILTPVILKQGTITKLPKLDLDDDRSIPERDVTVAQLYGTAAILILKQTSTRLVEVIIYMLNGPGLAPKKSHILRLGHSGRFAMNIVDDLVIVHHQASATSLIFDIALSGQVDSASGITYHSPFTPGRPLKPFSLKIPSLSLDGQTMSCDLYSPNWVLFQPNIVIDAKLGCLWYVILKLEPLCTLVSDKVRLVEFLLQRTNGKQILLEVLKEITNQQYKGTLLPIIENIFNKLNCVYKACLDIEIQNQTATPSSMKSIPKVATSPRVLIDQTDMFSHVFSNIIDKEYAGKILMLYLHSLAKYNIAAQHDLSKMIINDLVKYKKYDILQQILNYSLLSESKLLACFLLSLSSNHQSINQMALDMLAKLNANEIILEVLLGQGKVIDALRVAKQLPLPDAITSRKYLEAAMKTNDKIIFHSVYMFLQLKNIRLRGTPDFIKNEQCDEYIKYYQKLFSNL